MSIKKSSVYPNVGLARSNFGPNLWGFLEFFYRNNIIQNIRWFEINVIC
jgi:hypothetical protein